MKRSAMFQMSCLLILFAAAAVFFRPVSALAGPYDVPAAVPDTGQTKCYNDTGEIPCPSPGQDYYGQDANYTSNPMSFTKLSNGIMVKDNVTGLIWEVKQDKDGTKDYSNPHDADNTYTWYDPDPDTNGGYAGTQSDHDTKDFIDALNIARFGGYSDWRMPSVEELRSIVDYGIPYPGPCIDTNYFPDTQASFYWSSTTNASSTYDAWGVVFPYGYDSSGYKSDGSYVRAVRGGQ